MNEKIPKINDDIASELVDGLRKGYKEYLWELVEKSNNSKIYSGYRWTKSNHIDNNIEEQFRNNSTIQIHRNRVKNSGWQFNSYVIDNITLIQKPISYINEKSNFKKVGKKKGGYISTLSNKVNASLFENLKIPTNSITSGQIELLEPADDNSSNLKIDSGVFYLVTYNIGTDKDIRKIEAYAAYNGGCIKIQDLSAANSASNVDIPRDLLDQVSDEDAKGYESEYYNYYSIINGIKDDTISGYNNYYGNYKGKENNKDDESNVNK